MCSMYAQSQSVDSVVGHVRIANVWCCFCVLSAAWQPPSVCATCTMCVCVCLSSNCLVYSLTPKTTAMQTNKTFICTKHKWKKGKWERKKKRRKFFFSVVRLVLCAFLFFQTKFAWFSTLALNSECECDTFWHRKKKWEMKRRWRRRRPQRRKKYITFRLRIVWCRVAGTYNRAHFNSITLVRWALCARWFSRNTVFPLLPNFRRMRHDGALVRRCRRKGRSI